MSTLNEDLSAIKEVEDKIIANKVARFAYTDEAYTTNDANGVAEYNVNNAQNIPIADASVLKVNETVLSRGYRAQASSVTRMLLNHFFGRMSYNLNKVNDNVSNLIATLIEHRGTANGFATLDENGRIPFSQIPESVIQYVGPTLLGRNWIQSNKTNGYFPGGARYANGIWVACSDIINTGLWYSTDGRNWIQSNKTDGNFPGGARYANGIWVACSDNSTGLWYSTDGRNWIQSNKTDDYFPGGARYANGIWVACSDEVGLWYSTDGRNWIQSNKTNGYFRGGARYANGIWVACSNSIGLWYSIDGRNWTQSNKTDDNFRGGARYANGIWVACSDNNTGLWYSTDGRNWTQSNKTDDNFRGGARYANGIWVACSDISNTGLWYSDIQTLIDNGWLK